MYELNQSGMYDPYEALRGTLPRGPSMRQPGRQPEIPSLDPETKESWLSYLGAGALSGLGWLGSSLDKALGGRAIRGLLGGKPRELLSAIPFSDTMGITRHDDMVTGAELLGNDKDTPLLSGAGLAGMGAEILLDPATWLSFGGAALNKLGLAAKKAGALPKSIKAPAGQASRLSGLLPGSEEAAKLAKYLNVPEADVIGKRLGGHAAIGAPWGTKNLLEMFGIPGTQQLPFDLSGVGRFAQGVGNVVDKVPILGPVYMGAARGGGHALDFLRRTGKGLFDRSVFSQTDQAIQDAVSPIGKQWRTPEVAANKAFADFTEELTKHNLHTAPGGMELVDDLLEGAVDIAQYPHLQPLVNKYEAFKANADVLRDLGHDFKTLKDQKIIGTDNPLGYLYRQHIEKGKLQDFAHKDMSQLRPEKQLAREEIFEGWTKNQVNRLARENLDNIPNLEQHLAANYFKKPLAQLAQEELDRVARVADWRRSLGNAPLEKGWFNELTPVAARNKAAAEGQQVLKAQALHAGLAAKAMPLAQGTKDVVGVNQVLRNAGLGTQAGQEYFLKQLQAKGTLPPTATIDDLKNVYVDKKSARSLTRIHNPMEAPEALRPFINVADSITNTTKAWQTRMFPLFMSYFTRNQGQAGANSLLREMVDPTAGFLDRYTKPFRDVLSLRQGGQLADANTIKGLEHLSPADATQALQRELTSANLGLGHDLSRIESAGELAKFVPGAPQTPMSRQIYEDLAKAPGKDWLKPHAVKGAWGYQDDVFPMAQAGTNLNQAMDRMNQSASLLALRRQGYELLPALDEVARTHYFYDNLTPFEKAWMQRLVPFYSWSKANVPALTRDLVEKPGGRLATTIKGLARARGENPGFVPEYLGQGAAIPMGGESETGEKRFLSRTGLGLEDLGELASGNLLGMLNPLLKLPGEMLTGKQWFTGRDIADLDSRLSRLTGAEVPTFMDQLAYNSPMGRPLTTLGTAMDPRKSWLDFLTNWGTGLRLTDVDMSKARDIAVRNRAAEMLRGGPGVRRFERMYVRPEEFQTLSPAQQDLYRLYLTVEREGRQQQRARERQGRS